MIGWKTESMGQVTKIDSDHSVLCGIDMLVKLTNPGYSILDVGCYHGDVYDYIKHIEVDYLGIDLFESHIEQAKHKHPEANFKVVDLFQLEDKADIVFCSRVLMHIPDFDIAIEKLINAAKKYCIILIPIRDKDEILTEKGSKDSSHIVYFRRFSKNTVDNALFKFGLDYQINYNKPYSTIVIIK